MHGMIAVQPGMPGWELLVGPRWLYKDLSVQNRRKKGFRVCIYFLQNVSKLCLPSAHKI